MKEIILKSPISPTPDCRHLWYIFGWRDYIIDHLSDQHLQNHSRFNSFLISQEGGIAKLRAKKLPQDSELVPRAGIRLLKSNHENAAVGPAEFRIEKIEWDKIFKGLSIFLSKLPLERKMQIQTKWDCLRTKLEGLPQRSENFEKMMICNLPKQTEDIVTIPEHLIRPNEMQELRGELCPEEIIEGQIEDEVVEGIDVCIYTEEIRGRPWVGRIVEVLRNRRFKLQWYVRKTSRSKVFTALMASSEHKLGQGGGGAAGEAV